MSRKPTVIRATILLVGTPIGAAQAQQSTDAAGAFAIAWEHTRTDGSKYARIEGRPELPASAFRLALYLPRGHELHYRCADDVSGLVAAGSLRLTRDSRRPALQYATGDALLLRAGGRLQLVALEPTVLLISGVGPFRCGR
jgi:hypothetical protein